MKNQELWDTYKTVNSKDPYSKQCIMVAEKVMEYLDNHDKPLEKGYHPNENTAHGMICKADDELNIGLSGFQAGAVATIIMDCHERGEEFFNSYKN